MKGAYVAKPEVGELKKIVMGAGSEVQHLMAAAPAEVFSISITNEAPLATAPADATAAPAPAPVAPVSLDILRAQVNA
mgnify:CR=1 FL=1